MFVNVIHRCNLIHVSPLNCELLHMRACIDSIVRGLETSHVSASLAVGTPRYIVNTY